MRGRAARGVPGAAPAVLGAFTQAAGSLVVQVVCARTLGAADFGRLGIVLTLLVLATAVSTALVGDTATVLDRHDPAVRRALAAVLAVTVAVAAPVSGALGAALGGLGAGEARLLGVLTAVWLLEDAARRLLMASGRFVGVVLTDLTHLGVALAALVVAVATGAHGTGPVLMALTAGQACALGAALRLLPRHERAVPRRRGTQHDGTRAPGHGAWREVLGYGAARAGQAALRPAVLLVVRSAVVAVAGAAVYGTLEAARLYAAPALLVVNGVGTYLLPRFASGAAARASGGASQDGRPQDGCAEADRAAAVLGVGCLVATAAAGGLARAAPGLVAAGAAVQPAAVVSWGVYSAAVAVALPYGTLAAARRRQRGALVVRVCESALAAGVTFALLRAGLLPVVAAPVPAAGAAALGGLALRAVGRRAPAAGGTGGQERTPRTAPPPEVTLSDDR